jgi:hypothetical protein
MKIWFRTEAEHGGGQSPRQDCSVNSTPPCSPPWAVLSSTPPTKNPAKDFLRRGAARCARFSLSDQRHSLAAARSPWSPRCLGPIGTPPTENPAGHPLRRGVGACALFASRMSSRDCARSNAADQRRSLARCRSIPAVAPHRRMQFPDISTRFCPRRRSYTKQTIKPCLPGARTAHHGFRSAGVSPALLGLELDSLSAQATKTSAPACPADGIITVISNRELLVLETPQVAENKHRRPDLIENFEPKAAPNFRPFATAAFLPRGAKGSCAAFPLIENPRKLFNAQGAA